MHIRLPDSITGDRTGDRARTPYRHGHPARDLKPAPRPPLPRRQSAAPRRTGY
ncbi:hypothetical protein ACBI99_36260 [Nonomuraea sp. ATR24]|uniref:hypothetical protein n=1 Tax=Nonomuraea TaxID=83681 RepID=UPI001C603CF4|nr:hypothetical protein [Nonomuraea ceibae]